MFRYNPAIFYLLLVSCIDYVVGYAGLDFRFAFWIWSSPVLGTDMASFRKDFTGKPGLTPLSADILIHANSAFVLYVNGVAIDVGINIRASQRYCVPLSPQRNVIAVFVKNFDKMFPSALMAVTQIRYSNGDSELTPTDSTWLAVTGNPTGFEQVQFDDSQWSPASIINPFLPSPTFFPADISGDAGPSLSQFNAQWIWSIENPPQVGDSAFHKSITAPGGRLFWQVNILIAADDLYTLYINGLTVGSGNLTSVVIADRWVVNFHPTSSIDIAVFVRNTGGPAGLLAAGEIASWDCNTLNNIAFATDASWKSDTSFSDAFISSGFDDSAWPQARIEGGYGAAPWGATMPSSRNAIQSVGIPGAPTAPPAIVQENFDIL